MLERSLWYFIRAILLISHINASVKCHQSEDLWNNYVLGGFVGCLFEPVCAEREVCVDDNLFGKCLDQSSKYEAQLPVNLVTNLPSIEFVLDKIAKNKLHWGDHLVQWIVRTAFLCSSQTGQSTWHDLNSVCEQRRKYERIFEGALLSRPQKRRYFDPLLSSTDGLPDEKWDNTLYIQTETNKANYPWDDIKPAFIPTNSSTRDFEHTDRRKSEIIKDTIHTNFERLINRLQSFKKGVNEWSEPIVFNREAANNGQNDPPSHFTVRGATLQNPSITVNKASQLPKRRYQLPVSHDMKPPAPPVRSWVWVMFRKHTMNSFEAEQFLRGLSERLKLASPISDYFLDRTGSILYFRVPKVTGINAESVVFALRQGQGNFDNYQIEHVGFGRGAPNYQFSKPLAVPRRFSETMIISLSILGIFMLIGATYAIIHCVRRVRSYSDERDAQKAVLVDVEYTALRRRSNHPHRSDSGLVGRIKQFLESSFGEKKLKNKPRSKTPSLVDTPWTPVEKGVQNPPPTNPPSNRSSKHTLHSDVSGSKDSKTMSKLEQRDSLTSQRSSTSSWSSEPVSCGIDLTTGHVILSYMEGYLHDEERLTMDWNGISTYEAEEATPCEDAQKSENLLKNRIIAPLPFEQSRVRLRNKENDYINASLLYDHSPRNPSYIATPSPMVDTLADFWEMIWEQTSVVIVCLERMNEFRRSVDVYDDDRHSDASVQYWPNEGAKIYGNFEVHLVSEHNWCDDYVVRSIYLKNLETGETRTVTQFHYLVWHDSDLKTKVRSLLEFRRKVNRSFRGMMSPIVVHCIDGSGRTGTYILMDLVLNRISKGVKEINIAASLEHLRDQRQGMVSSKEQYEFVFAAVAKEVDFMLKTTGQTGS